MRGLVLGLVGCLLVVATGCKTDRKYGPGADEQVAGAESVASETGGIGGMASSGGDSGGSGGTAGTEAGGGEVAAGGALGGGAGAPPNDSQAGAPAGTEVCSEDEFDAGDGCQELTTCGPSQYEQSPPRPDQDRVCAELTQCSATEYEKSAPTANTHRECASLSVCAAGTFVSVAPTATSDRTCTSCPASTFSSALNAAACAAWGQCNTGETQSVAPTATSDRVCSTCGAGKYESGGSCLPLTVCSSTEYESKPATATSNRVCKAVSSCAPGTRQTAAPTATTDRQCAACSSGTFSSQSNAMTCPSWTQCTAAQYESGPPSSTKDRGCSAITTCAAGTHILTAATSTSDRVCEMCPSGKFTSSANQNLCQTWANCSPGFSAQGGSTTTNRVCTACTSGFSTTDNAAMCKPWTVCTSTQMQTKAGTATSDAVCVDKPTCSTALDRACTTDCPCPSGVGVCTASNQCQSGSSCVAGSGKKVGRSSNTCLATHCNNDQKDSGETSIDCGGECGCLATYESILITGVPSGATFFRIDAMSGDGSRLAGSTVRGKTQTASSITAAGALTELQSYGTSSYPRAISADGNVVVGQMYCADPPDCTLSTPAVARWTGTAAPEVLSPYDWVDSCSSTCASVAGVHEDVTTGDRSGFLLTSSGQRTLYPEFSGLGPLSPDGKTAAASPVGGGLAGLWHATNATITTVGDPSWSSSGISALNGQTLVATGVGTNAQGESVGFRWKGGTLTTLGVLSGGTRTEPYAISADGGTIIGVANQGAFWPSIIWTDSGKLRTVVDELKSRGYEPPADLELNNAYFLSNDGKIIAGMLDGGGGFWRVTLK